MNNSTKMLIMFLLIILIFAYYSYMTPKTSVVQSTTNDSLSVDRVDTTSKKIETLQQRSPENYILPKDTTLLYFETDLLKGKISSLSGSFSSLILKNYKTRKGDSLELLNDGQKLFKLIIKSNNLILDFSNINFFPVYTGDINPLKNEVDSLVLVGFFDTIRITRTFIFKKGSYLITQKISSNIPLDKKEYIFEKGISFTEDNISDELQYYGVSYHSFNNIYRIKEKSVKNISNYSGNYDWMGVQTKYFFAGIIGKGDNIQVKKLEDKKLETQFSILSDSVDFYVGPIDYRILKQLKNGMDKLPDFGWSWIQPISKLILSFLIFMYGFIPNYGVIIILLSIILIIIFSPLTFTSFSSMRKMQMIQPQLEELKKKYAKDPQKLNTETMNLYKKSGINPFMGCLPLLIQMPIFFALYAILRTTIELRQAPFAFWIKDLSYKDPFYVLPILTGITMFVSQKISSTATDESQKMLVYIMPVMITILFLNMPSGINLYWFIYNILSVGQQILIKNSIKKQMGE
ncbi:MAG: membrane protein insertase YidC [candidate division WOR-3 bacterium]